MYQIENIAARHQINSALKTLDCLEILLAKESAEAEEKCAVSMSASEIELETALESARSSLRMARRNLRSW